MHTLEIESNEVVAALDQGERADIPIGITGGLSNDAYHDDRSAVSSTQLKRMLTSPAHFIQGLEAPQESSEAQLFGQVLHARLLKPGSFDQHFFGEAKINRATKVGKALAETFKLEAGGRTRYPAAYLESIDRIVANMAKHAKAREILAVGEAEVAIAWNDPETGVKCKTRIDWWNHCGLIADVKSAADVTREGFAKACARFHYSLSAFVHCEGVRLVTGERPDLAFVACEKEAPNTVAVYRTTADFLKRGELQFRRALRTLATCRVSGHYPMMQGEGYWKTIDLPSGY